MRAVEAPPGTKACDSWSPISDAHADALLGAGIGAFARYTDNITNAELQMLLGTGALVFFVTSSPSNGYVPTDNLARSKHTAAYIKLKSLNIPATVCSFVDLEGMSGPPAAQISYAEASCSCLTNFTPGLYCGAGVGLTGHELYAIPSAKRYWKSLSRVEDRFGAIAEPQCGWAAVQAYPPNLIVNGVQVDIDMLQKDFEGRSVICVAA